MGRKGVEQQLIMVMAIITAHYVYITRAVHYCVVLLVATIRAAVRLQSKRKRGSIRVGCK